MIPVLLNDFKGPSVATG